MANKSQQLQDFKEVAVTTLTPGDVIYITKKPNSKSYTVLDVGHPFILIENNDTHFATLYRPVQPIYKKTE